MIKINYKYGIDTYKPCVECDEMLEITFRADKCFLDVSTMKCNDNINEVFICKKCGKKYILNMNFELSLKPVQEEDTW